MRFKQFDARRPIRLMDSGRRIGSRHGNDIGMVMLKIARMRYQIFRDRFGREPGPDEPLFFDSKQCEPVLAGATEMCSQIRDAATATRSDYLSVMKFLGLG